MRRFHLWQETLWPHTLGYRLPCRGHNRMMCVSVFYIERGLIPLKISPNIYISCFAPILLSDMIKQLKHCCRLESNISPGHLNHITWCRSNPMSCGCCIIYNMYPHRFTVINVFPGAKCFKVSQSDLPLCRSSQCAGPVVMLKAPG